MLWVDSRPTTCYGDYMKHIVIIAMCLALGACTSDHYTPIPDSDGSSENLSKDLGDCRHDAIHKYYASKPPENPAALVAAGVIGGALGGAIFGAASSSGQASSPVDINKEIEKCMADRGYTGVSDHYN